MPPADAVLLDNWYPGQGQVQTRPGISSYATGLGTGPVETVTEFIAGSTRQFLGACGTKVYDISSSGAVGPAVLTGAANARWQTANFSSKQFWVNGADTPQTYDGTSFSNSGWSGSGLTATNLVGVIPFKTRLFFWENQGLRFWYPQTPGAVTGTLTKFDLSLFTGVGGNVVAITTLGYTTGNTPDDLCCIVLSTGDVLVFQGTDPGDAAAWALVGKYTMGTPVGIRAFAPFGGDCYFTTLTDHSSLNTWFSSLQQGKPPNRSKVSGAVIEATSSVAAGTFGWQAVAFPKGGKLFFNVPNANGTFDQHVANTVTGAWCRYRNINPSCLGLYRDNLYGGAAGGVVVEMETGTTDLSNAAIGCDGQQAWQELGSPYRKRISAVRPIIQSGGGAFYSFGVGYDFNTISVSDAQTSPSTGAPWNTSMWNVSYWGVSNLIDSTWRVAGGTGQSVATRLKVSAQQSMAWMRTDFRLETGVAL